MPSIGFRVQWNPIRPHLGLTTPAKLLSLFLFLFFFSFFCFLGPHLQHMGVPRRLGVESELQLPTYTTATQNPSHIFDLHHSSQQCQIPDPPCEARDWTLILMDTSRIFSTMSQWELPRLSFQIRSCSEVSGEHEFLETLLNPISQWWQGFEQGNIEEYNFFIFLSNYFRQEALECLRTWGWC